MEAAALRAQGWSIAAIARHLGRDLKTIRAYLDGERTPGQRRSSRPDPFAPFADYVAARLAEDRHVWASALYDEVVRWIAANQEAAEKAILAASEALYALLGGEVDPDTVSGRPSRLRWPVCGSR